MGCTFPPDRARSRTRSPLHATDEIRRQCGIVIAVDELAGIPLFSTLAENELEYLAGSVEDIRLVPGEYVAHEGEGRFLVVVVEGKAELTKVVNGVERVIGARLPGEHGGAMSIILGTPMPASLRATEPSRVLRLSVKVFYTLAAMAPELTAAVGAPLVERLEMLRSVTAERPEPAMVVIGPRLDPGVHAAASFLERNRIPYDRLGPDDPAVAAPYPVVELRDGTRLVAPSLRAIATVAGLIVAPCRASYDVVIVGGGPAGLTAAVNAASEGLQTGLIECFAPGGQAGTSTRIENYTGFPFGVSGDDLASRALQQAKRLGAEIVVTRRVHGIDPAAMTVTLDGGDVLRTSSIVLAPGVEWRRLAIDSLERLVGSGVYYGAARSDAAHAHGNDVFLIGAGNSAGQAAIFLSGHARSVTLLVRGESLAASMSHYLVEKIATKANIRVETRSEVVAAHGDEQLGGGRRHRSQDRHDIATPNDGAVRDDRRRGGHRLASPGDRARRARLRSDGYRRGEDGTLEVRSRAVRARDERPGDLRRGRCQVRFGEARRIRRGRRRHSHALVHRHLQASS